MNAVFLLQRYLQPKGAVFCGIARQVDLPPVVYIFIYLGWFLHPGHDQTWPTVPENWYVRHLRRRSSVA